MIRSLCLLAYILLMGLHAASQEHVLKSFQFAADSLALKALTITGNNDPLPVQLPVMTFRLNNEFYASHDTTPDGPYKAVKIRWSGITSTPSGIKGAIIFENISGDTINLKNVVPFGEAPGHTFITGLGNHHLSRTHLFLPGKIPVNVIVPDNAWDMGYCSLSADDKNTLAGLVRREKSGIENGSGSRFETTLYPGGSVKYLFYAEMVSGNWQAALNRIFQQRMLYDVDTFKNDLFGRKDLQWIRHSYVMHMMMTWNKSFYDIATGQFNLLNFIDEGKKLYGGDDAIAIWPTWPTLGLDQRNQFDLFRDLPGSTRQIKKLAIESRAKNARLFVCYNPWDESTRNENHFLGITDLIKETSADGVVLDTKGESSAELQRAADKVREGVIMYSEGMAVPKDMQGIVSGRVHNALYYPPMLNLNKLIKPEFSIFRVTEINKERVRREFSLAFFNGYGTEINIMLPGSPDWLEDQYRYLGQTSMLLRQNTSAFVSQKYTPLIAVTRDSIWVNQWETKNKTVYTVYSLIPQGYKGNLFEVRPENGFHFVDLFRHTLLKPDTVQGKIFIEAQTSAFDHVDLGTNNEGAIDCIAKLPALIKSFVYGDELTIETDSTAELSKVKITAGNPAYDKPFILVSPGKRRLKISETFGRFEGKFVIQLLKDGELADETVVQVNPGTPRRISGVKKIYSKGSMPEDMVKIPAGRFLFHETHGDEFISYPTQDVDSSFSMPSYYMDRFPVTNKDFRQFLAATRYHPSDTVNFLKHWKNKKIPSGMESYPVVYISYEDAKAYASWAGKRLPSEIEWQYAAQTSDLNSWPWRDSNGLVKRDQYVTNTLKVSDISNLDSTKCNTGNGKIYPVGRYPAGKNPFGLYDLVGCVWQLTNDLYMSGNYNYILMKGGSYFKAANSWWYVQGGPRELQYRQYLLRVSQGFERNATVGFRCVQDLK